MKKIILIFSVIFFSFFKCQKIGIASNINSKLGYSHTKAGIKFNPIFEKDLDYDLMNFVNSIFLKDEKKTEQFSDFNWNRLGFFDQFTNATPILDYLKSYCESKNIEELYLIRKINSFKLIGPMDMFFNYKNNFGIMTFPSSQKRALMYYNFGIYKYSLKKNKVFSPKLSKSESMDVYLNKSFNSTVYDENKMLKNKTVQDYFLPIFEKFIDNSFTKLNSEKDVFTIFKYTDKR